MAAAECAVEAARAGAPAEAPHVFTGSVEHAIAHIEESLTGQISERKYTLVRNLNCSSGTKKEVLEERKLDAALADRIEQHIQDCEKRWTTMRRASSPTSVTLTSAR